MIEVDSSLSIRKQCLILDLNRSSYYALVKGESEENLKIMMQIDKLHYDEPTYGVLRIQDALKEQGIEIGEKRVRRLMRKMCIETIYPKQNLSKLGQAKYVYPYLLRNMKIQSPNQVWAIDITYIPMKKGFMYLTAIIDLYSRYIVGWDLSNNLLAENQTELLANTIKSLGKKPEIINSDQGAQYTCENWVNTIKKHNIQISMDGKGRATDNAFIERFFRTLKWDSIYLHLANDGLQLYNQIHKFVKKYNFRSHQGICRRKPVELYQHF